MKKEYLKTLKGRLLKSAATLSILFLVIGCEDMIRDNLLILDQVASFSYQIDTDNTSFSETERVDLQLIIDDLDGRVEDVRFYNITMQVVNRYNTPATAAISGQIAVKTSSESQFQNIVTFNDITLEEFETERSIFSDDIAGISVNSSGIETLKNYYGQQPAPELDFNVSGTADPDGAQTVRFDFTVKVYSQFETDP